MTGSGIGPESDGLRWIERPAHMGLRFVGFCDELSQRGRNSHQGWYTDSDGTGETLRGAVWQVPARNGKPVYVAGYREGTLHGRDWRDTATNDDSGAGCIDMRTLYIGTASDSDYYKLKRAYGTGKTEAASHADSIAERAAESACEYNDAWRDGSQYEGLREVIADARREALELFKNMRRARRSGFVMTSDGLAVETPICRALRRQISELVDRISEARRERAELWNAMTSRRDRIGIIGCAHWSTRFATAPDSLQTRVFNTDRTGPAS